MFCLRKSELAIWDYYTIVFRTIVLGSIILYLNSVIHILLHNQKLLGIRRFTDIKVWILR